MLKVELENHIAGIATAILHTGKICLLVTILIYFL